jgi:SAM-dependent methyltransferase
MVVNDLHQRGVSQGLVVDLGCGGGVLLAEVAKAGYNVLGIDISESFVDMARRRVSHGEFRVASCLDAELPPCVAVAATGECLNYSFDERHSWNRVWDLARRVYQALAPGGSLIFDIAEPGRVDGAAPVKYFNEGTDWAVLVTAEEDRETCVLTRQITTFRKIGENYRRGHEVHRQRLLHRNEVVVKLQEIGFDVQVLSGYGDTPFIKGDIGFLARKLE